MKFLISVHIAQFMASVLIGIVMMSLALHMMEEKNTAIKLVSLSLYKLSVLDPRDI